MKSEMVKVAIGRENLMKDSNLLVCERSLYVGTVGEMNFILIRRHSFHIAPWLCREYPLAPVGAMASCLGTPGLDLK